MAYSPGSSVTQPIRETSSAMPAVECNQDIESHFPCYNGQISFPDSDGHADRQRVEVYHEPILNHRPILLINNASNLKRKSLITHQSSIRISISARFFPMQIIGSYENGMQAVWSPAATDRQARAPSTDAMSLAYLKHCNSSFSIPRRPP
jgi:hypothetical protein